MAPLPQADRQPALAVEEFLETDPMSFGTAWRYELVDGLVIAHAAPVPDHGAIVVNLAAALRSSLSPASGCRAEAATAAVPQGKSNATARVPDVLVRCSGLPRVMFEVVSSSELRNQRARDAKRRDLQDVAGAEEIVEIYQHEHACHVYRRQEEGGEWTFDAVDGPDGVLHLRSVDVRIPLSDLYSGVLDPDAEP